MGGLFHGCALQAKVAWWARTERWSHDYSCDRRSNACDGRVDFFGPKIALKPKLSVTGALQGPNEPRHRAW